MENWYKNLLKYDKYHFYEELNKDSDERHLSIFHSKNRFLFYQNKIGGNIAIISKEDFSKYVSNEKLDLVSIYSFLYPINSSDQLKNINDLHNSDLDNFKNIDYEYNYNSMYEYTKSKIGNCKFSFIMLGKNITKNIDPKDALSNSSSYVMFYYDNFLSSVVVFKDTYKLFSPEDLSFDSFKESQNEEGENKETGAVPVTDPLTDIEDFLDMHQTNDIVHSLFLNNRLDLIISSSTFKDILGNNPSLKKSLKLAMKRRRSGAFSLGPH